MDSKNNTIPKLILAVTMLSIIALTGCTTGNMDYTERTDVVMTYKTYGGFVMISHAIQELRVEHGEATFTVSYPNGTINYKVTKKISEEQYAQLIKTFYDNDFLSMDNKYTTPSNVHIVDAGIGEISLSAAGINKTVVIDPYVQEYIPNKLKKINSAMNDMNMFLLNLDENQAKAIAENFIEHSVATYKFDGGNLQFKSMVVQESYPETYVLTYSFMSSQAGYGDRSEMFSAQVMTQHELRIAISRGEVVSAVTDGRYNEITGSMIGQGSNDDDGTEMPPPPQEFPVHLEAVTYQPMQCQQTPWQKWYADGNIQFVKEPTDEGLLIAYYSQTQNITVSGYSKLQNHGIVSCSACDVCSTDYYIQASVSPSDAAKMENLGWSRVMQ